MSYNLQQFVSTLEHYDELICDVQGLMSSLNGATSSAKTTQDNGSTSQDDMSLDDGGDAGPAQPKQDVEEASDWVELTDVALEMSKLAFTAWFEKGAKRLIAGGKQGTAVKIPLGEYDCPSSVAGITLDGAIKGQGKVSAVEKISLSMADRESLTVFELELKFRAYFTAKNDVYKKATIMTFNRTLSVCYSNIDGASQGLTNDAGSDYTRVGGDDEAVRQ